ncbi:double zinc ribbon domain-containing protein [Halosolutus halophilus]|uniref:double zinc ribbon domain-containing protein n=1 Tax=Halosolutus halophilus TaxID=1552990 RepID=UPI0022352D6C|nr:zinc ribbon domain-containing protein [Halosolutus halophilus]
MSKITFRADDDLVDELETLDASKSEVMREALRAYLTDAEQREGNQNADEGVRQDGTGPIDDLIRERVDTLLSERVGERPPREPQDVNVSITLDGNAADRNTDVSQSTGVPAEPADRDRRCSQCGEDVDADHVYCPNCGEKASRRSFCECGDELRSDWAFCPSCGRRTPAADVLDSK